MTVQERTTERPRAELPATQSLLRGPRIHLRPIMAKDNDERYRRSLDLPARGRWFPSNIRSEVTVEASFAKDGRWTDDLGILVMVHNEDERLLGYVIFGRSTESDVDEVILGYLTYPEFRGQGYASEATRLFAEYLFSTRPDMNRAALYIHPDNAASIRIAERCGFTLEGRFREGWFNLGEWHDLLLYGLLRRELVDGRPPAPPAVRRA